MKTAAECNLRCNYCYWFADPAVLAGRPIASEAVSQTAVARLAEYLHQRPGESLTISFHGGEPLLVGKERFARLCEDLNLKCAQQVQLACQTNGMLIDDEWISIFRHFNVHVGVSIDGPPDIHDARRTGKHGARSHHEAKRGLELLQAAGLEPGILAVWSPSVSAKDLVDYFTNELGVSWFDVLLMDATYDTAVAGCSAFYCDLFDIWLRDLVDKRITVRICEAIARTLLGLSSGMESIGHGQVSTLAINTEGRYELLDVLNIAGNGLARTAYSVFDTSLEDFLQSQPYLNQVSASHSLCEKCNTCRFKRECGGGYLPSRWSNSNGFDNPSAHCASLYQIFEHCDHQMRQRLVHLISPMVARTNNFEHLSPN